MAQLPEAAVLCGGLGTRLRDALPGVPKGLAPIGGKPFLDLLAAQITGWGVRRILLCTGAGAESIRAHFAGSNPGAELTFSEEREPLGTAGALALARPQLQTDPVLVLNGDSMVPSLDFVAFLDEHRRSGTAGSIVLAPPDERRDTGTVRVSADGRVTSFAEKVAGPPLFWDALPSVGLLPSSDPQQRTSAGIRDVSELSRQAASGASYVSAGIYLLSQALLAMIPTGRPVSLECEMMPLWLQRGVHGFIHRGKLVDIGTPERWREAQATL